MSIINRTKHWLRDLVRYPAYHPADASYDAYWSDRDMRSLNAFQKARIDMIVPYLAGRDSVLDIGCGDGRILAELKRKVPGIQASGIDSSSTALEQARRRGIAVRRGDIRELHNIDTADWVLLLEMLEHMPRSEELLAVAVAHAKKGVIFSVPNTGFMMHRLRLLLGSFPLQWRSYPGEHLRFWTMRDMRWWLDALGYAYELRAYEGVPLLNKLWPALYGAGLLVVIKK
jgi:methionine biosynthesis protein MetW